MTIFFFLPTSNGQVRALSLTVQLSLFFKHFYLLQQKLKVFSFLMKETSILFAKIGFQIAEIAFQNWF